MAVPETLRFLPALAAINVRASLAQRASFWLQATFMLVNNLTFFTVWMLFFNRFEGVRGWTLGDVGMLFGVTTAGFGLSVVFAGGVQRLGSAIVDGNLDPLLVQPKHVLLQQAGSQSRASGWGDTFTGVLLLTLYGALLSSRGPLVVLAVLASAAVFTSAGVIFHSLAFWLGRVEMLSQQLVEFTLTFSLYPSPLFGGGIRILLFTVIPAGFVGYLPVELARAPTVVSLLLTVGAALGSLALAAGVFRLGLREYQSGSSFGSTN